MTTGQTLAAQTLDLKRVEAMLEARGYVADHAIAMSAFLALALQKPLLVEGPAGVGKTEIAKAMAGALGADLIRLQCYEGLDASAALYEWNYRRQLLHLKIEERGDKSVEEKEAAIFGEKFLLKRPILQALTHDAPCVLLVDELDRADEEFESFLLEALSDWQITIPEIGTIRATHIPAVVVTSNGVRELSEALRRRCLYLWIDYPDFDKELRIVRSKLPDIDARLAEDVCAFMRRARELKLNKVPGVAETLDWARALCALHADALEAEFVADTLGVVFKDREDVRLARAAMSALLPKAG